MNRNKFTVCLIGLAFVIAGCDKPEEHVQKHETVNVAPPPPPAPPPVNTNPFEKPPPTPPGPVHEAVQNSHWEQVGGEFKMNDSWSLWTWRDTANHNTCYFYNVLNNDKAVIGHGMSCITE